LQVGGAFDRSGPLDRTSRTLVGGDPWVPISLRYLGILPGESYSDIRAFADLSVIV
jgi:hypothetical protein